MIVKKFLRLFSSWQLAFPWVPKSVHKCYNQSNPLDRRASGQCMPCTSYNTARWTVDDWRGEIGLNSSYVLVILFVIVAGDNPLGIILD